MIHNSLLAFLAALLTIATAAPATLTAEAALAATSCKSTSVFTAKFDALTPGATPTPGFGGVNWSGFTVDTSSKYGVNATSGKLVARLPDEGATISGLFQPNSFAFACIASIDLQSFFPNSCSLQLILIPAAARGSITTLGPYTYNPGDIASQGSANMTKVVLNNVPATSTLYWNVVAGAGDGQLLVDNVVLTTQNSCPA